MRGKLLTNDPVEIAAIEHKERLYKAIAMLSDFINGFSGIAPEDYKIRPEEIAGQTDKMKMYRIELLKRKNKETGEILNDGPAELFARQCAKEKQKDPYFNRSAFARVERTRTEGLCQDIENLPGMKNFLGDDPAYKIAHKYIQFLNELPEEETNDKRPHTFKGKHTTEQRNLIRDWLIENRIIANINQEDFEYLFSEQPIKAGMSQIKFLKFASWAKWLLCFMVEGFENNGSPDYIIANQCIILRAGKKLVSNSKTTKDVTFEELRQLI